MNNEKIRFKRSIYWTLSFVLLIWLVKILEYSFDYDLSNFGILPRTIKGSIGIFMAPLIHGDIYHLISNTFPILFLGIGILYFYDRIALLVIGLIYIISGFWVWIAARDAYHVGASGVIYGMLSFLILSGFLRKDNKALALSFVVLFLYGTTLFSGIIPSDPHISWESHLMGAIAGVFCAIYFRSTKLTFIGGEKEQEVKDESTVQQIYYHYELKENKKATSDENGRITYTYQINNPASSKKD